MDQDLDGVVGEDADDIYTGDFTIVCCPGDEVASRAPAEFRSA